ncbi:hypothetical protein MMC13_004147 [Lambiella insularis]|nr:hypothetical protein [Lambiella insularis]
MHTFPLTVNHPLLNAYLPKLGPIAASAFLDDEYLNFLMPGIKQYPLAFERTFMDRIKVRLYGKHSVVRVAVSDDSDAWWNEEVGEEVLGFSTWDRNGTLTAEEENVWGRDSLAKSFERLALTLKHQYVALFSLDLISSPSNIADFNTTMEPNKTFTAILHDQSRSIWLGNLAVDPRFQRRGIGKRLLRWGLERAGREGVRVGQWASRAGDTLYESVGFEKVGEYRFGKVRGWGFLWWPDVEKGPGGARERWLLEMRDIGKIKESESLGE